MPPATSPAALSVIALPNWTRSSLNSLRTPRNTSPTAAAPTVSYAHQAVAVARRQAEPRGASEGRTFRKWAGRADRPVVFRSRHDSRGSVATNRVRNSSCEFSRGSWAGMMRATLPAHKTRNWAGHTNEAPQAPRLPLTIWFDPGNDLGRPDHPASVAGRPTTVTELDGPGLGGREPPVGRT